MTRVIHALRRSQRFAVENMNAWRLYLAAKADPHYHFTPTDCWLYIQERQWQTPPLTVLEDAPFQLLQIEQHRLFWPRALDSGGLSWLYCETMMPFEHNPSSYNHPAMALGNANWVLDLGACEGFFSLLAAELGARHIYAVEPVKALSDGLRRTVSIQKTPEKFTLMAAAVASQEGEQRLNTQTAEVWNSTLASGGDVVHVTTLDALAQTYDLGGNGVIKMDIEGAEMDALTGGKLLLARHKPRLAIAVYHAYDNARLCRDIIQSANPDYQVQFRGMYGWAVPERPRPYLLFAW
ncbi:MAG: FkbM family methyltransferase [Anaerolineae bacterium]|nr:FkbM family methyltransferase [Anaerolineae bacterium]NUQ06274.1 FkbM family methyltransferase [Anaerolineae bacterium]